MYIKQNMCNTKHHSNMDDVFCSLRTTSIIESSFIFTGLVINSYERYNKDKRSTSRRLPRQYKTNLLRNPSGRGTLGGFSYALIATMQIVTRKTSVKKSYSVIDKPPFRGRINRLPCRYTSYRKYYT